MDSLRELFIEQLQDAYDAEKQLIKALPKMAKEASSTELKEAIQTHLEQTRQQVERLEQVFESLEEEPEGKPCKGMAGVIAEGKETMEEVEDDDVRDAAIIMSAQKVEHYEMATYGTLKTFASLLDEEEAANLLEETLNEEKEADQLLSELAEEVNARAEGEDAVETEKQPMRRSGGRSSSQRQGSLRAKGSTRRKR
jgi:ferritin-like metal-binding protein YciE